MKRSLPDEQQLGALLGRPSEEGLEITALGTGTTGQTYRVVADGVSYAAKYFSDRSGILVGPEEQFALLDELSAAGISPRPIAVDQRAGLLVTELAVDSEPIDRHTLMQRNSLNEVTALLLKLHRITASLPAFTPRVFVDDYVRALGGTAKLSRRDRERFDELSELESILDGMPRCLCHNDLTVENILLGDEPRLIDFDYAVMGAPILDLASLSVMNEFDERTDRLLLSCYFGDDERISMLEFARVQRLVRLVAHFWSLSANHLEDGIVTQYRIRDDN